MPSAYVPRVFSYIQPLVLPGGVSYTAVILVCMITWFICKYQGKESISIEVLPRIVVVAAVFQYPDSPGQEQESG